MDEEWIELRINGTMHFISIKAAEINFVGDDANAAHPNPENCMVQVGGNVVNVGHSRVEVLRMIETSKISMGRRIN